MSILPCSVPDCDEPIFVKKRELCRSHYNRFLYSGDLNTVARRGACSHCGGETVKGPIGPLPKYCSKKCLRDADYARNKDRRNAAARERNAAKPLSKFACSQCGESFEARKVDAKFCSKSCCTKWNDAHAAVRCSEAGCERGVRAKRLCNLHWRRKARAEGREAPDAWDERRKANYQKRRALKLQLPADDIRPADVYERDEWVCGLCSEPVDRSLSWPDPMSPSLDHVLPLSKGGHHVMGNVQLAHLSCNVRKGARTEELAVSA